MTNPQVRMGIVNSLKKLGYIALSAALLGGGVTLIYFGIKPLNGFYYGSGVLLVIAGIICSICTICSLLNIISSTLSDYSRDDPPDYLGRTENIESFDEQSEVPYMPTDY